MSPPNPRTHPNLGWKQLVGQIPRQGSAPLVFNYPHLYLATPTTRSGVMIYLFDSRNGQVHERQCTSPGRAVLTAIQFARTI